MMASAATVAGLLGLMAETTPWWDAQAAGWIGGIGGAALGVCGGVIGILCGLGRGRTVVLAMVWILLAVGALALAAGIIAAVTGQPYAVYYPLLLDGSLVTIIVGANYRTVRRRYEQIELRRMQAADLG